MQKTGLDRWLRRKFVYETQVYCNTLPHHIPPGVALEETTEESGGRYLYRFTASNDRILNELTARLEMANITYTSRIAERGGWKGKLFNNPQKSFTIGVMWIIFIILIKVVIFSGLPVRLWKELSAEEEPDDTQARIVSVESARRLV